MNAYGCKLTVKPTADRATEEGFNVSVSREGVLIGEFKSIRQALLAARELKERSGNSVIPVPEESTESQEGGGNV